MPLPASGAISLLDVATEFGGAAPHALNEYYGVAAGIPASGTISLADFYGASSLDSLDFNGSNPSPAAAGWTGPRVYGSYIEVQVTTSQTSEWSHPKSAIVDYTGIPVGTVLRLRLYCYYRNSFRPSMRVQIARETSAGPWIGDTAFGVMTKPNIGWYEFDYTLRAVGTFVNRLQVQFSGTTNGYSAVGRWRFNQAQLVIL